MIRKVVLTCGLLVASTLLVGCGSGGLEAGMPKDASGGDFSKVPDPMAGVKILPNPSPKATFNDPMKPANSSWKPKKAAHK